MSPKQVVKAHCVIARLGFSFLNYGASASYWEAPHTHLHGKSTNAWWMTNQRLLIPILVPTNSPNCGGRKTGRGCATTGTNSSFMPLCKWIKTRHVDNSSPDEPRLAELWLLSTRREGDKTERQPAVERCGSAEPSPRTGSAQSCRGANEHLH